MGVLVLIGVFIGFVYIVGLMGLIRALNTIERV